MATAAYYIGFTLQVVANEIFSFFLFFGLGLVES